MPLSLGWELASTSCQWVPADTRQLLPVGNVITTVKVPLSEENTSIMVPFGVRPRCIGFSLYRDASVEVICSCVPQVGGDSANEFVVAATHMDRDMAHIFKLVLICRFITGSMFGCGCHRHCNRCASLGNLIS